MKETPRANNSVTIAVNILFKRAGINNNINPKNNIIIPDISFSASPCASVSFLAPKVIVTIKTTRGNCQAATSEKPKLVNKQGVTK